jgi:hypothetical protein
MPKVTVRPTKQEPNYKRIAVTGAGGNATTAVSDQGDGTYIRRKVDGAPTARFRLATPAIPTGHDVATIVPGARLRQPTSRPPKLVTLAMSVPGTGKPKNKIKPTVNGPAVRAGSGTAAYTYETPAAQGRMAGPTGPWSGLLSSLAVRVNDGHAAGDANRAYIYDLFADVYCAARPTVALQTTPATPITGTSYPEVNATFSALVESWQDNGGAPSRTEIAYELKVFSSAQYLAGGFDPATSPAVWSTQGLTAPLDFIDGATPSSEQVDETPDVSLPNGTYRIYARGRRCFDAAQFGAWAYVTIALNVQPCPAPLLSATLDDAAQRIILSTTPQATAGAASPLTRIERSEDGGATWEPVRGATLAAGAFGVARTDHDYEAARATALQYRACTEASFADVQLVSDYRTAAVAGTLSKASWNLKCPLDPSLNVLDVLIDKDPEWSQNEDAATFRPVGRKYPVVVSMSVGGADGSLSVTCHTDAEWAAVEELRDYAGALLLESPYGWSRYIRILQRSWSETGVPGSARRRVAFAFLEVGVP